MNHKKQPQTSIKPFSIGKLWNFTLWFPALIVGFVGFCLYMQTFSYGYVLDDKLFITQNEYVQRGIIALPELVSKHSMAGSTGEFNQGRYRPVPLVMFALEWQIAPNNPRLSHIMNVVLYACTAAVLVIVLLMVCGKQYHTQMILSSLLWVAHPTHTEVVANIKSRDILLGVLFSLLSLWFLLRYVQGNQRWYEIVFGACMTALAMLSQESSLLFVGFLPLCLYFFSTLSLRKILVIVLPFSVAAFLCLMLRAVVVGEPDTQWLALLVNNPYTGISWIEALPTKIAVLGRYLVLTLFPHTLVHDYGYNQIPLFSFGNWQVIFSLLLYGGIAIFSLITFKRRNFISFCGLAYCLFLAIASNIFLYYGMPMSDRMLYSAALPAMMAIIYLLFMVQRRLGFLVFGLIFCLFIMRTVTRNPDWESDFTLNRADIQQSPNCLRMRVNYATLLMDEANKRLGDSARVQRLTSEALSHLHAALAIHSIQYAPTFAVLATYHSDFAARLDSALYYWIRARSIDSLTLHYRVRELYIRAMLQSQAGRPDSAITLYRQALPYLEDLTKQSPTMVTGIYEKIYVKLGLAYSNKQDFTQAQGYFEQALALNPSNTTTSQNVTMSKFNSAMQQARVAEQYKQTDTAIRFLHEALQYNIRHDVVYAELGALYLQQRRFDKAYEMYLQAKQRNSQDPLVQRALEFLADIQKR